jgi:hypothetical protein
MDKMRERISLLNATVETLRNETRTTTHSFIDLPFADKRRNKFSDTDSLSLMLEQVSGSIIQPSCSFSIQRYLPKRRAITVQWFGQVLVMPVFLKDGFDKEKVLKGEIIVKSFL